MRLLLMSFFWLSFASFTTDFIDTLPNGHFAGEGVWEDGDDDGSYQTYVELFNNEMRVDYDWDGESITIFLSFWFTGPGLFNVAHGDTVVGSGSCDGTECHYRIVLGDIAYSESLTFIVDNGIAGLIKAGRKKIGERTVVWRDELIFLNFEDGDPPVHHEQVPVKSP